MTLSQELLDKKQQDKRDYETASLSFKEYLSYVGKDYERDYSQALLKTDTAAAKTSPLYGKSGEALRGMGLADSGYASYLKRNNDSFLNETKKSLYADYLKNLDSAKDSYANYLISYREKQTNIAKSLIDRLENDGILDFNKAYQLAIEQGLSEENARAAAESGTKAARDKIYNKIIEVISRYRYSRERAEIYAKEMGLTEKDVKSLGDYAYRINQAIYSGSELIENIENQHTGTQR